MKKVFFLFFSTFTFSLFGQGIITKQWKDAVSDQFPSIEIGLGYTFQHEEGFGIPRFTLAVNNLLNAGLGFYLTPEYRGGILFEEDGTDYYFRMPIGFSFEVGQVGFFIGADPISASVGKHWRKEIGLIYAVPNEKLPLDIRLGYSGYVGPTLGIGYRFDVSK